MKNSKSVWATIGNGIKRAVTFVVDVLLFVPRLIFKGVKHIFSSFNKDENKETSDDNAEVVEPDPGELNTMEENNTKDQADHISKSADEDDINGDNVVIEEYEDLKQQKEEDTTDKTETGVSEETAADPKQDSSVVDTSEIKKEDTTKSTETKEKEQITETSQDSSVVENPKSVNNEETAAADSNEQQATVTFEKVDGEVVDQKENDTVFDKSKVSETVEEPKPAKEIKVELKPTDDEKAIIYDPTYIIANHVAESVTPVHDSELLDLYNRIVNDKESHRNNLDSMITLRKASQVLVDALGIRNGYQYKKYYDDDQSKTNEILDYLVNNHVITENTYRYLVARNGNYAIWLYKDMEVAQNIMLQNLSLYFTMVYPKTNPTNTLENIRKAAATNKTE